MQVLALLSTLLLQFHPTWVTHTVSSYDPTGGNGDGNGRGYAPDGEYVTLFHGKGEGRITRLWMTAPYNRTTGRPDHYDELWIITDGVTQYRGDPVAFFEGRAGWQTPLVLGYEQSSKAYLSYVPFPYAKEAKVLFRGEPKYYQLTYREGPGSSEGPSGDELHALTAQDWTSPPPGSVSKELLVPSGQETILFEGPGVVAWWSLSLPYSDIENLQIRIGDESFVPLSFFMGLAASAHLAGSEWQSFTNALYSWNRESQTVTARLPLPLGTGDTVRIANTGSSTVAVRVVSLTHETSTSARLVTQYRDQWAPGSPGLLTFFESDEPVIFVSLQHEITDGLRGNRLYLEGDERITTDAMILPLHNGTGTEDYYNGGWYFSGPHANAFAGQPRFLVWEPEDRWSRARFEHSLYRHHLADPIVSRRGLHFGMEAGEIGAYAPLRVRTLGLAYRFPEVRSLGTVQVDGLVVSCPKEPAQGFLMVRTYDSTRANQEIPIRVNGRDAGLVFNGYINRHRPVMQSAHWVSFDPADCDGAQSSFTLEVDDADLELTFY